jgi:uncharacterized protein YndB with AHSA1/START domain
MKFQRLSRLATSALFALCSGAAMAATTGVSPSGFVVTHRAELTASPAAVYAAIGHPNQWWNAEHSYSGKAENFSLDMRAGGCFCEAWDGNSVEHARVISARRDRLLRLEGGLGPLQDRAVSAVLTFTIATLEGKTILTMTYRVRGADADLDKIAAPVDGVLGDQFARLTALVEKK